MIAVILAEAAQQEEGLDTLSVFVLFFVIGFVSALGRRR